MLSIIVFVLLFWLINRLLFKKQASSLVFQEYQRLESDLTHYYRATHLQTQEQWDYWAACNKRLDKLSFLCHWLRL